MKNSLKINYSDQWSSFDPNKFSLHKFLVKSFNVELSDTPDYLIAGPYSFNHLKYDCVKILWTGESVTPDFNLFDYAIGFDHIEFGDRYLRAPLYALRDEFWGFRNVSTQPQDAELINRDFCSFVVSNGGGDPIRRDFFEKLSKYKKIDSGGRFLNNIGGPVKDKAKFVGNHKFSITFENLSYPGYVTEKMMEAHAVWSVPIYWGDPRVESDFNPNSFIWVRDREDIDEAIEKIIELDHNDDEYLTICKSQPLVHPDQNYYWDKIRDFFSIVFSESRKGQRLVPCGGGASGEGYQRQIIDAFEAKQLIRKLKAPVSRVRHFIHKFV